MLPLTLYFTSIAIQYSNINDLKIFIFLIKGILTHVMYKCN